MPGQKCSICTRDDAAEIAASIMVGAASLRRIAAQFGTTDATLRRHRDHCMKGAVQAAVQERNLDAGESTLSQCRNLQAITSKVLSDVNGDPALTLKAVAEARKNLELLSKLLGDLDERPVVNIIKSPEWVAIRSRIIIAVDPIPGAREALLAALGGEQ